MNLELNKPDASVLSEVVPNVDPAAAVKVNAACVAERTLVKPVVITSKALPDRTQSRPVKMGTEAGKVSVCAVTACGVTAVVPAKNCGVMVITPATVPVFKVNLGLVVVPAGRLNRMVRKSGAVPLAN